MYEMVPRSFSESSGELSVPNEHDAVLNAVFWQIQLVLEGLNRQGYEIGLTVKDPERFGTSVPGRYGLLVRAKLDIPGVADEGAIFITINTQDPLHEEKRTALIYGRSSNTGGTFLIHDPRNCQTWTEWRGTNFKERLEALVGSATTLPPVKEITHFQGFKLIPLREGPV